MCLTKDPPMEEARRTDKVGLSNPLRYAFSCVAYREIPCVLRDCVAVLVVLSANPERICLED